MSQRHTSPRAQPNAAVARRRPLGPSARGHRRHFLEIRRSPARQTSVQPGKLRRDLRPHLSTRHLGLARPVGSGRPRRRMAPDARRPGLPSRPPRRHQLELSRSLPRCYRGSRRLWLGQAMGRMGPSIQQRCITPFRFLHDLRSNDYSEPPPRPHRARRHRRRCRLLLAIQLLSNQRVSPGR